MQKSELPDAELIPAHPKKGIAALLMHNSILGRLWSPLNNVVLLAQNISDKRVCNFMPRKMMSNRACFLRKHSR
jgi:hypothetical protein